jgi:hypothetical protein
MKGRYICFVFESDIRVKTAGMRLFLNYFSLYIRDNDNRIHENNIPPKKYQGLDSITEFCENIGMIPKPVSTAQENIIAGNLSSYLRVK